MSSATDRTAALRAARAKDSRDKRARVLAAIHALEAAGTPITAATVAASADVSTWLVYAEGAREHLDAARRRQAEPGTAPVHQPDTQASETHALVGPTSLRTDLALAREQIRRLRTERDQLRARLRLQLGAEIDGPERAELITRVAQLETSARQLAAERDARAVETEHALRRTRELEDDLTAARDSLRQVIKDRNR